MGWYDNYSSSALHGHTRKLVLILIHCVNQLSIVQYYEMLQKGTLPCYRPASDAQAQVQFLGEVNQMMTHVEKQ